MPHRGPAAGRDAAGGRVPARSRRLDASVLLLCLIALSGLGGPAGLPGPGPALVRASCATTPVIDEAVLQGEVVFVGTVLQVSNDARWATVRVEERWRGARDLGGTVGVRGGPEPGTSTALDRTYSRTRYLFVVRTGPGYLEDDACTATTRWEAGFARLRPLDVAPAPDVAAGREVSEITLDQLMPAVALLGALIIAVIAYIVILRARRRPADWIR